MKEKKRPSRNKVFWGVLLAAWLVIAILCILAATGVLPDRKVPAPLYVACGLGIFTSVMQLWRAK